MPEVWCHDVGFYNMDTSAAHNVDLSLMALLPSGAYYLSGAYNAQYVWENFLAKIPLGAHWNDCIAKIPPPSVGVTILIRHLTSLICSSHDQLLASRFCGWSVGYSDQVLEMKCLVRRILRSKGSGPVLYGYVMDPSWFAWRKVVVC